MTNLSSNVRPPPLPSLDMALGELAEVTEALRAIYRALAIDPTRRSRASPHRAACRTSPSRGSSSRAEHEERVAIALRGGERLAVARELVLALFCVDLHLDEDEMLHRPARPGEPTVTVRRRDPGERGLDGRGFPSSVSESGELASPGGGATPRSSRSRRAKSAASRSRARRWCASWRARRAARGAGGGGANEISASRHGFTPGRTPALRAISMRSSPGHPKASSVMPRFATPAAYKPMGNVHGGSGNPATWICFCSQSGYAKKMASMASRLRGWPRA